MSREFLDFNPGLPEYQQPGYGPMYQPPAYQPTYKAPSGFEYTPASPPRRRRRRRIPRRRFGRRMPRRRRRRRATSGRGLVPTGRGSPERNPRIAALLDMIRSAKTGRFRYAGEGIAECPAINDRSQICNPRSGRVVKISGAIGQGLIDEYKQNPNSPTFNVWHEEDYKKADQEVQYEAQREVQLQPAPRATQPTIQPRRRRKRRATGMRRGFVAQPSPRSPRARRMSVTQGCPDYVRDPETGRCVSVESTAARGIFDDPFLKNQLENNDLTKLEANYA